MWIEKQKNGKYKYIERYADPYTDKYKKTSITLSSKSRQAQKEAQRLLNEKIDNELNVLSQINPEITFGQVLNEWLSRYEHQVKYSTYYAAKNSMNTLSEYLAFDLKIVKIDHIILNKIFDELLYDRNLSNDYVRIMKSRVSLVFKHAMKKGYVIESPMEKVEIAYKREEFESTKKLFLEDDEYKKLIEIADNHNKRYSLFFQWLYLNGLRAGEGIAMKKSDVVIDEENNIYTANINGTMDYHGKKVTEQRKSTTTKTKAGMREIDLSKKAIKVYQEAILLSADYDTDYIFCTAKGTPLQITAINSYLRNYITPRMEIDKTLSSHIFRHTHVSKLAELGTPIYAIQDRVGHENSKITESIYLHITKGVRDKLKNDIEKM